MISCFFSFVLHITIYQKGFFEFTTIFGIFALIIEKTEKMKEIEKTEFVIGEQVVEGELILEKNNTDINKDFYNVRVYKLDYFEPDIPFEGTSITEIEKEFPDKKFSIGEVMDKYLMFKDEILVCDDVD